MIVEQFDAFTSFTFPDTSGEGQLVVETFLRSGVLPEFKTVGLPSIEVSLDDLRRLVAVLQVELQRQEFAATVVV